MKRPFGFRARVRAYIGFLEQKKLARMKALACYPRRGGILFLGDSLTEEFPFADLLPGFDIVGRGYSGDTAGMLQERLSYTCAPYAPKAVFLQAGINDLQRGASPEEPSFSKSSRMALHPPPRESRRGAFGPTTGRCGRAQRRTSRTAAFSARSTSSPF